MRGADHTRACFRYRDVDYMHRLARIRHRMLPSDGAARSRLVDKERAWRAIEAMERTWPSRDVLFHCRLAGVCPQGLVTDDVTRDYLLPERIADQYKSPPATTVDAWPARLYDAFAVIRATHQQCENERVKEKMAR